MSRGNGTYLIQEKGNDLGGCVLESSDSTSYMDSPDGRRELALKTGIGIGTSYVDLVPRGTL